MTHIMLILENEFIHRIRCIRFGKTQQVLGNWNKDADMLMEWCVERLSIAVLETLDPFLFNTEPQWGFTLVDVEPHPYQSSSSMLYLIVPYIQSEPWLACRCSWKHRQVGATQPPDLVVTDRGAEPEWTVRTLSLGRLSNGQSSEPLRPNWPPVWGQILVLVTRMAASGSGVRLRLQGSTGFTRAVTLQAPARQIPERILTGAVLLILPLSDAEFKPTAFL
ncbi:hypothetical protein MHYP_G00295410 [Metynnis hypsauchen]